MPTIAERTGNFSGLRDAAGRAVPIYDPFSTRSSPTDPTLKIRDVFAGNIIPASEIDPVAAKAASYFAEPNQAGNLAGANNYNVNVAGPRHQYHGTMRVDHELTSKDKIFGRYVTQYNTLPQTNVYPLAAASGTGSNSRSITNMALTWLGSWTHTFSPSLLNEFKVGGTRQYRDVQHASYGENWAAKLGLSGVPDTAFPVFIAQTFSNLGATPNAYRSQRNYYYQIIDSISWFHGSHSVKTGFEYRHNVTTDKLLTSPSGRFNFAAQGSGLQSASNSGNGFATMLLGFVTQATLDDTPNLFYSNFYMGGYLQDDWKVSSRLTLNLGIRYDVETARTSPDNISSSFNGTAINPVAGVPGVVTFAGQNGVPNSTYDTNFGSVAPRFGFAWRPVGKETTVVRGAFGVFFGNPCDFAVANTANLGYATSILLVSPDQNQTPAMLLKNGFPAYKEAGAADRNPGFGVGGPVDFYQRYRPIPYSLQYNIGVQHEWKSVLFEAKYLSTLGRHLTAPILSMNQVAHSLVGGSGTIQARRPYPQFTDVSLDYPNLGASSYHALLLRAEKRYHNGLQLLVNYTWSKFMDNINFVGGDYGGDPSYEDFYNRRLDKSLSANDIPSNVSLNVVYELPVGHGRRWLQSGIASQILGGWQISTLGIIRSGPPFGVTTSTNTCECFSAGPQRANILRDPTLPADQRSPQRWFDTTAFSQPGRFLFGTAARAVARAPGSTNFDAAIIKNFAIPERFKLQFRGELFNAFNFVNFGLPGAAFGTANFGTITTAAAARIIQLGLKLNF